MKREEKRARLVWHDRTVKVKKKGGGGGGGRGGAEEEEEVARQGVDGSMQWGQGEIAAQAETIFLELEKEEEEKEKEKAKEI